LKVITCVCVGFMIEYWDLSNNIFLAITGTGGASKEQVREMLRRILSIPLSQLDELELDATDGLAAALCHYYESSKPAIAAGPKSWKDFIAKNPDKVKM